MSISAKILILDIETAPANVYTWGLWDQNISLEQILKDSYMLSWSAKWYGDKKIMSDGLINYKSVFKSDSSDEHCIAKTVWKLMDEADIIVAHNGNNFDLKWLNTVFLRCGMKPPSSFKSIDTLKESRSSFYQLSHKMNFLCARLDIGHKLKHEGFKLWRKCMDGNKNAWNRMLKYNVKDVVMLEELYDYIKPFMKHHPNLALYSDSVGMSCPTCQSKSLQKKGFAYTNNTKFQRYVCTDCGKNTRDRNGFSTKQKGKNIRNVKS